MKKLNLKFHKFGYGKIVSLMEKYRDLSYKLDQLLDNGIIDNGEHMVLFETNCKILKMLNEIKKGM